MDRDQRIDDNWALLYAQQEALIRKKPLLIVFFIAKNSLNTKSIQTIFQMHGLAQVMEQCAEKNITFSLFKGSAEKLLPEICAKLDCHLLLSDFFAATWQTEQSEKDFYKHYRTLR